MRRYLVLRYPIYGTGIKPSVTSEFAERALSMPHPDKCESRLSIETEVSVDQPCPAVEVSAGIS